MTYTFDIYKAKDFEFIKIATRTIKRKSATTAKNYLYNKFANVKGLLIEQI